MTCSSYRQDHPGTKNRWTWKIELTEQGYWCVTWHAHENGTLGECPEDRYGPFTHEEFEDFLDVLWFEIWADRLEEEPF